MKAIRKTGLFILFVIIITVGGFSLTVTAAKKPALSKKKLTLTEGETGKLTVRNQKKNKVSWKSSDRSIVSVSSKGKVKARKKGEVKVTAILKNKKGKVTYRLVCRVTVEVPKEEDSQKDYPKWDENSMVQEGTVSTATTGAITFTGYTIDFDMSMEKQNTEDACFADMKSMKEFFSQERFSRDSVKVIDHKKPENKEQIQALLTKYDEQFFKDNILYYTEVNYPCLNTDNRVQNVQLVYAGDLKKMAVVNMNFTQYVNCAYAAAIGRYGVLVELRRSDLVGVKEIITVVTVTEDRR